ncbi:hypothetical protein N7535_004701 [Penicillium sp. DV-2018c]|nr:hypothetical protein N7461_008283 [Penicillium sp. DV-2018c]KAJ5571041.1 hypothetical protein N7535_004701 [Penicillium sp. DV-2018c]
MSTNRSSSSRLRGNSPPTAAAANNPNPLQVVPKVETPREGALQYPQWTEDQTAGPTTAEPATENPDADLRELEDLKKRLAVSREKARLLAEIRKTEREIAIMEAEAQGAAPHRLLDDAASLAGHQPPEIARVMPAASVVSQGSALASPNPHEGRVPRAPSNMGAYKAQSPGEYDLFKSKQEAFWSRSPEWHHDDARNMNRSTEFLSSKVNNMTWMEYCKNNPGMEPTWPVFETWALSQFNDPVEMQRDAERQWWTTTQAKHQDVHQYALRLIGIYHRLREAPNREQRIGRLQTGVLKEIQDEARRYPAPTTDRWDDWVAFYNHVEKSMPSRASYLKDPPKETPTGPRDMTRPSKRPREQGAPATQQSTQTKGAKEGKNATAGSKRKRSEESKACYFCNKPGHLARECRKKAASEAAAQSSKNR